MFDPGCNACSDKTSRSHQQKPTHCRDIESSSYHTLHPTPNTLHLPTHIHAFTALNLTKTKPLKTMITVHEQQMSKRADSQVLQDAQDPCSGCDVADMHSERVFNQIQRFYREKETPVRNSNAIRYTSAAQVERLKAYSNNDFAASRIRDLNNGYLPSLLT